MLNSQRWSKTTKPPGLEAIAADGQNLTWINVTVDDLAAGAVVKLTNDGKLYSHPFLGVPDAEVEVDGKTVDFRCSEHCTYAESIEVEADSSSMSIQSLTSTDPARRSNGTVYADTLSEAEELARSEISYKHEPSQIIIQIIEPGNKSVQPSVNVFTVNEAFSSIEVFEIDAATEFLWALSSSRRLLFDGAHPIVYSVLCCTSKGTTE